MRARAVTTLLRPRALGRVSGPRSVTRAASGWSAWLRTPGTKVKPRGSNHFLELLLAFSVWAPECCCCCHQDSPARVQTENPYVGQETSRVSAAQAGSTSEACARGSGEGRRTRKQGSRRSLPSVPWLLIPRPGAHPSQRSPASATSPPLPSKGSP